MILGRSTPQWAALITAAGGLIQLLVVTLLPDVDPVVVATIIGAVVTFLGVFIAFLANTQTTPTDSPRLKADTEVDVLDDSGHLTGDKVVIQTTPPGPTGHDG